jgi:RNA polymerase sigma-70 factor (ECF subfamily)
MQRDANRAVVESARRGDASALAELYRVFRPKLYRYLRRSVRTDAEADDLTSEAFVRMLESIHRFEWRTAPFSAWLYSIARNLLLDYVRAAGRHDRVAAAPTEPVSDASVVHDEAVRAMALGEVARMTASLPKNQRDVVALRFGLDLGTDEIARALETTPGAVKIRQHRAVARLAAELTDEKLVA